MINALAKALAKIGVGPTPSYGFGPGAKAGVSSKEKKKKARKEAVSGTSAMAQLRPTKKKESTPQTFYPCTFKESSTPEFKNHKFEVVLIKEGLGNFRDRFFYTKECLKNATGLFEGAQSYADHPSESEEQDRPERSTRDILGYYENVQYKETEGQGSLVADLILADTISLEWATSLLTNSIEYSKKFTEKDLAGLSINASGSAQNMPIEDFIKSNALAEPVLNKLKEAISQGISEINIVNELKEAQSVDLVTRAGAGGRILQMLEQEKKMKRKHLRENESMETEDGQDAAADGATPDHADADQDQQLFAQMIKQYLGKQDPTAEEMEMAQHAHEAAKEMGMEGKEAYEAAGTHLKMAMAVGKKMAQKESKEAGQEGHQESSEHEGDPAAQQGGKQGPPAQAPPPSPKSEGKKESMNQVLVLSGEVAKLRESVRRYELRDYLDKKLAESGKTNSVTKKFRETLGTPKSKEQIDGTWKIFVSAYEAGAEEVGTEDVFFGEKTTYRESSGSNVRKGLADCLR